MRKPFLLTAALCLGLSPGPAVVAQESQAPGLLRQAALSADLYRLGLAQEDALLVLAAAKMRRALDFLPPPEAAPTLTGWEAMAEAARELAAGDPLLLDLIEDSLAESLKGVATGPTFLIRSLADPEGASVELEFSGGTLAEVYVEGAIGNRVSLAVSDAAGNPICRDSPESHIAYCDWTPAEDGAFLITVSSLDHSVTDYILVTN
ncbi:hypothetical protein [Pseudogemmobacter sonorensis]|uniref:hypothetical protein n=1 Tax=Pseudogemmobacter sonorensis TaxID=2989681 RepID=UPI003690673C